ncbi:mucin-like protein 3 [Castor canadensis]|uniref:Mucin-like protein 3 n=1 Tax=Castor canadensis TaxID=51338 RepID=A0AC58NGV4_CASCN
MAQPAGGLCSTFGFQCCLLFLLASWELGTSTSQELQKTGEFLSDHLFPLTQGFIYNIPSESPTLHSGQRLSDLPKLTETHKPKRHCNTTRGSKPTHKPIDTSKTTDHKISTAHHEALPTSEQNTSSQEKDPVIRNGRSVNLTDSTNTEKISSGEKFPTSAPKSKTTCKPKTRKTRVTRNSSSTVRPVEKTITTLDKKKTTSHEITIPFHNSVNPDVNRKTIFSSEKTTQATWLSQELQTTRTPETSERAEDYRTTDASDKSFINTTRHIKETTSVSEKDTKVPATPVEHEGKVTLADESTGAQTMPTEHEEKTTSANETTTRAQATSAEYEGKTISANEIITRTQALPTEHEGKITLADETTRAQVTTTEHEEKTISANELTTRPQVTPTEIGGKITLAQKKTPQILAKPTEFPEEATSTIDKTTTVSGNPIVLPKKTTLVTETVKTSIKSTETSKNTAEVTEATRPQLKTTGDKSVTTAFSHLNKTEVIHQGPTNSLKLTTSGMHLSTIMSGTPGNQSHPNQNNDGSSGGLHAGVTGENDSFPAWAIVIVILVAVILLLVFIGLIFLVAFMTRARGTLIQNTEDNDPEDDGGPNSYPVYLMEQQNFNRGQIPSS